MENDTVELVESEAEYKGFKIIISSIGRFFVLVYRSFYIRPSLADATKMIDEMKNNQKN